MDTASLVTLCSCMTLSAIVTIVIAADLGPRATPGLGLTSAALGVVVVGVLAILAVALNRWLPRA